VRKVKSWEYMAGKKQTVEMGKKEIKNFRCKEVREIASRKRGSESFYLTALGGWVALQ